MPYTDEQIDRAAEAAMNFDPSKARVIDATPIRVITEATDAIREAEARQREAVQVARARGISWNLIAPALGVSRQAARQRFGGGAAVTGAKVMVAGKAARAARIPKPGKRMAATAEPKRATATAKPKTRRARSTSSAR